MTFAEFAETKKFKTIMNYVYSLGAAVVIAGALFKIMHWPGANFMLIAGMGTEVFVFVVFAIDPTQVHMELDWTLVYPELADGEGEHGGKKDKKNNKSVTQELDGMLEKAKIGPELIESLGSGMRSLSDSTAKLTNLSDASVAANEFSDNMKKASQKIGTLSSAYDKASSSISSSISDLENASSKTSQALDLITNSTQQQASSYSDQLQKVSKSLGSLNNAYELQLQTVTKAGESFQSFEKAMASLGESTDNAKKLKHEIASLSENLSALNTVYGGMLTAMNTRK